jgi:hypothetical protein
MLHTVVLSSAILKKMVFVSQPDIFLQFSAGGPEREKMEHRWRQEFRPNVRNLNTSN